jgi:metallo-beta-lactamase family protein
MKLTFCGGAGSVTGANYLLESDNTKILIDCGLEQGSNFAERRNFEAFPYNPADITAVYVTHAHVDHIGRLPKLWKDGFKGKIFSTLPTRDFAEILLLDSEHILAQEAERENQPALYRTEDIDQVMRIWEGVPYHAPIQTNNFSVEFLDAGHILGSAIIRVKAEGKTVIFSGDLGNYPAPILQPTEQVSAADYCLVESTYGDRVHEKENQRQEILEDIIEETVKRGGTLLIPAFAMERTQELLYNLHDLFEQGRIPRVPVFIDSPLAIKLTRVYKKYESFFNPATRQIIRSGDDILNFPGLHLTLNQDESKGINDVPPPKIIIAGSGMSQGGRILHHEVRYLPDPKSTILFVGYQAQGSLGRRILEGATTVRILGQEVPVHAEKRLVSGYSAHADQPRLLAWLRPMRQSLKTVFVVQGEPAASEALATKIRDELTINAVVPQAGSTVEL